MYQLTTAQLNLFTGLSVFFGSLVFMAVYGLGFKAGRLRERLERKP